MQFWSRWRAQWHEMLKHRDTLVGINRRNVTLVYAHNPRSAYPEADDKLLCKELMAKQGVGLAKTLAVCDGLFAIPQTLQTLSALEHFVVKPANASGGEGILVVGERISEDRWRKAGGKGEVSADEIRYRLGEIVFGAFSGDLEDRAFVEERIFPHQVFADLWSGGLCDVRVITVNAVPVLSMVRVPTFESDGRANLHQGGIGLAVDIDLGITTRAYYRGRSITHHPEGGAVLVGVQLPDWKGILDTACRAARSVRLGYLGVDVVVDRERGPLVLEVNARPGLEIQNVHGRGLGEALQRAEERAAADAFDNDADGFDNDTERVSRPTIAVAASASTVEPAALLARAEIPLLEPEPGWPYQATPAIPSGPTNSPTQEPEYIGRYQVVGRLASGGMAEVFLCAQRRNGPRSPTVTSTDFDRFVVVKRILPHLAGEQGFIDMFLTEARYVARINHQNVVPVYELGEDNGLPFLAMEYVAGCSLRDLLVGAVKNRLVVPAGIAAALTMQACAGAHAAHEMKEVDGKWAGLVHRDISPHNLMVTAEGHVKLLDFGIAKATDVIDRQDHTLTGVIKGKVHYMAPEQCRREPVDRRIDVFALGIVAWELLAKERLFQRGSELETMQAIVSGHRKDLRLLRHDIPPLLFAAIEKALQTKKEDRFDSAEAFRRALVDASRELDTSNDAVAAFVAPLLMKQPDPRKALLNQGDHIAATHTDAADETDPTQVDKRPQAIAADLVADPSPSLAGGRLS